MIYQPRIYQSHAIEFAMDVPGCILMMDCGVGKCSIAATVAQRALYDTFDVKRWIVVAPKRVASQAWPAELEKWNHLRSLPYRVLRAEDFALTAAFEEVDHFDEVLESIGTTMKRRGLTFGARADKATAKKRLLQMREHVHIVSFDFLPWLVKAYGVNWPYDGLIIDESSFVKNQDTERFRALSSVRKYAKRVIELTGTPAPRGLLDLWPQIFLIDGGKRLGQTYGNFREAYFTPDKRNAHQIFSWKIDPDGKQRIYDRIDDIAMSLSANDWLQLPQLVNNKITIVLPPGGRKLYDKVETDLIAMLNGGSVSAANAAVLCFKLLQIANGCVYDDNKKPQYIHDAKLNALSELVEATSGGVLCAYAFKHDIDAIKKRFGKAAVLLNSDASIDQWNQGKIKLALGHPASMGHGVNIQHGGSNAVWYSPTYNAELYEQFNKRLHRSGQTADRVVISHILAENTLDRHVLAVAEQKLDDQGALLAAVRARISESR